MLECDTILKRNIRIFESDTGGINLNFQAIMAIMDRGEAANAVEAVNRTGSHSGTLLRGRGSGLHEKQTILNVALEPEKDILLLVTPDDKAESITNTIDDKIKISEPGQGILYSMQVNRVHGL